MVLCIEFFVNCRVLLRADSIYVLNIVLVNMLIVAPEDQLCFERTLGMFSDMTFGDRLQLRQKLEVLR